MRKSLLYAALIAALAVLVCGGTLANPQEEAVAQTSGGVGQFKGQCRTASTTFNDPIVSGHLSYANAGQTLPCCKRHNEDQADELRARGMPLGLMPSMSYEEKETTLVPRDAVLFCTDGLVEAHNAQGEMGGTPRLRSHLSECAEAGRGVSATLMQELERFTGEG